MHSSLPSFLHSFLPSFLPSFLRSFVRSFVHSFIDSLIHYLIRSVIPSIDHLVDSSFDRSLDRLIDRLFVVTSCVYSFILTAPFKPRIWRTLSRNTANFRLPNHPLVISFGTLANASSSSSGSCDCVAIASCLSPRIQIQQCIQQQISKLMHLWHALNPWPNLQCCEGSIWSLRLPVAVGVGSSSVGSYQCCRKWIKPLIMGQICVVHTGSERQNQINFHIFYEDMRCDLRFPKQPLA